MFSLRIPVGLGLEAVLTQELKQCGYKDLRSNNGYISLRGDARTVVELNLRVRMGDRVRIEVGESPAPGFDALFEQTKSLPWEEFITPDGAFPVNARSAASRLHSVPSIQSCVKKAIVERLREKLKRRDLPESGARFGVEAVIVHDTATLTLDTTGDSLHRRGYRTEAGEAPLRETLGAGLILLSDWQPEMPLVDPCCGSGTLLIEAALLARNIAPGLQRHFAAEEWPIFSKSLWQDVRTELHGAENRLRRLELFANDHDGKVLDTARRNAERAGVLSDFTFRRGAAKQLALPRGPGTIVSNPPYGVRLGGEEVTHTIAKELHELFSPQARDEGWSLYVLTADEQFEKSFGERCAKKRKLYNGGAKVHFYQYPRR